MPLTHVDISSDITGSVFDSGTSLDMGVVGNYGLISKDWSLPLSSNSHVASCPVHITLHGVIFIFNPWCLSNCPQNKGTRCAFFEWWSKPTRNNEITHICVLLLLIDILNIQMCVLRLPGSSPDFCHKMVLMTKFEIVSHALAILQFHLQYALLWT